MDAIPAWFWIPAAIALWPLAIMAITTRFSSAEDPNPDEPTRLDTLEHSGIYPR